MNRTKKILSGPKQEKKVRKPIDKKVYIIISAILGVLLIGALLFDQLYKRPLMKINEDKYYLEDLNYYIYDLEAQYDAIDQMFGGQYWDMVYDQMTGITVRDAALQEAIETALMTEVLYKEAMAKDYQLTEEENETITEQVNSLLEEKMDEKVIKKNNFTKEGLRDSIGKITLANRYRKDLIDSLPVDDEGIKAGIDPADYKRYDIEYLFISTQETNEDNEMVSLSDEDKQAAYDKISSYYDTAKNTEDWSSILADDEEDVVYREDYFLESGTDFSEEFQDLMKSMENGSVSDIYEAENGYYIVRMVDNDSSISYDNAVSSAISRAESQAFSEEYDRILSTYDFDINENILSTLDMGEITLVK